jgi:hypothetical protein
MTPVSPFQAEISKISVRVQSILSHTIKWFAADILVLKFDKMNIMEFITRTHHILHYMFIIKKSI